MTMNQQTIAVLFGGRSAEHEVSVISGHQVMDALKVAGYKLLPIYISKEGEWFAGTALHDLKQYRSASFDVTKISGTHRVSLSPDRSVRQLLIHPKHGGRIFNRPPVLWADVFFPAIHGSLGEDGALQGLFEWADVPYVGADVLASAVGMDKVLLKRVYRDAGIAVLDCVSVTRKEWQADGGSFISRVENSYKYPVIVKPVRLGSSIGVSRCSNKNDLELAIEAALILDERVLVERALEDFIEVNCSVLGPPEKASVCEQPVMTEDVLSFDSKYKRGGKGVKGPGSKGGGMASLERLVPAPISKELTSEIQKMAIEAFRVIGASGVARIDFLLEKKSTSAPEDAEDFTVYLNEINTIPGSFGFYLWEKLDMPFDELVTNLVEIAVAKHQSRQKTQFSFQTNLLQNSP